MHAFLRPGEGSVYLCGGLPRRLGKHFVGYHKIPSFSASCCNFSLAR